MARVSRAAAGSTASAGTIAAPATAHVAGNLIVVATSRNGSAAVTQVQDTALNTYHPAGTIGGGGAAGNSMDLWYAYNIAGNAANVVTVTFSSGCTYRTVVVSEFDSFGTSDPFVAFASNTGSSTALSSGTVSVGGASSALIAAFFLDASNSIVDTSPAYNTTPFNATGDAVNYFADGYRFVSANEAAVATGANTAWGAIAAAFVPPSTSTGPTTWAQLVTQANAEFVVLADVQVRQSLRGWTSDGAGAYYVPYDLYTHPTTIRTDHGLYRGVDSVLENLTPLTLRASIAAVQANSGSYFYDSATGRIYVRTAAAVNPDTISLMQAVFTVCASTHARNFVAGRHYAPMLDGNSIPSLHAEQSDFLSGLTIAPSGALSMQNADGFWDYPASAWNWMNGSVTIRIGGEALPLSEYQTLSTLLITQNPAAGDLAATLSLRSLNDALAAALPQHTYDDLADGSAMLTFPNAVAASELHGQYMPVIFGTVYGVPLQRLDIAGVTDASYTICSIGDPRVSPGGPRGSYEWIMTFDLLGGRRRNKATGAITELALGTEIQKFSFSTTTGNVKVTNGYSPDTYDFFADVNVQWLVNDSAATVFGSVTSPTVGSLLLLLLVAAGIPLSQIDTAALATADAAAPEIRGVYIAGGTAPQCLVTTQDAVNRLRTFELIYVNTIGKWTCKVWDPSFAFTSLPILTDRDILSWTPNDNPSQPVASNVPVLSRVEPGTGRAVSTSASSLESVSALQQRRGFGAVSSPYVDSVDAATYAQRLLALAQQPPVEIDVVVGPAFMTVSFGDKFRVMRARGPSTGTTGFDQVMEVISFTKNPASMTVDLRLSNMRGLGESVKRVAPAGTPDWGSATADQKRQYLYAVDDTLQRASAGDPASFRPGVWW